MKTRSLLMIAACAISLHSIAQIEFGGRAIGLIDQTLPAIPVVQLPGVDVQPLLLEDEVAKSNPVKGPARFGVNHAVDLGSDNSGTWNTLPNGDRVWRIAIRCPEARSVNFEFGEYVVPEGGQVFVYNELGEQRGAYTAESNPGHTELGVFPLGGDLITIEYDEPAAVAGQGHLRITQVTHAYKDILGSAKGIGDSGSCNNNTICPEGDPWRDQIASVAMIVVSGNGICTGQLLNNCANDGTPYFLTANHCLPGNLNVSNWIFRFKWESSTCATNTNVSMSKTVSGASLLAHSGGSDVALLELNSTPPSNYEIYYSGWDKSGTAQTSSTVIHHPAGDIKKISFDYNGALSGNFDGAQCWRIAAWDDGTTEGGSSGSGLWNQDKLLVGQLFGGEAWCGNNVNDYFGKFSVSYPLLDEWLGDCGNTLQGFDPNSGIGITEQARTAPLLTVQPNPGTGLFTIRMSGNTVPREAVVRDAIGREVARERIALSGNTFTLDLQGLPAGTYALEVSGNGLRAMERLIIQH